MEPFLENTGLNVTTQNQQSFLVFRIPKMIRLIECKEHNFHLGQIKAEAMVIKIFFPFLIKELDIAMCVCLFLFAVFLPLFQLQ